MYNIVKYVITLFVCVSLNGCAKVNFIDSKPDLFQEFSRDASFYIAVPEDGTYGNKIYTGSGVTTARIIAAAFRRQTPGVYQGNKSEGYDCTASARRFSATYAVCPSILHWEDRATEWSGIRDKVEISITIIDANDGRIISSAIIEGKSGYFTLGGDHPQDLLEKPVNEYVSSLYQGHITPSR